MKRHFWDQVTIGLLVVTALLVAGGAPSHASTVRGGFHGGSFQGRGFHHAGFNHPGFHHGFQHHPSFHHGFRHHRVFFHRPCCFGPRVFVGVGVGVPFFYPYAYPVYSPPLVVESAAPTYVQPEPHYWYYCQGAQAYYPYVKECPGGWLQVVPRSSPPLQ